MQIPSHVSVSEERKRRLRARKESRRPRLAEELHIKGNREFQIVQLLGLAAGGSRVLKWARFVFRFGVAILPHAQYGPYYVTVFLFSFFLHGDDEHLDWFVFSAIRNTKLWNHFHMFTVVLWTKIVVEFVLLWSGLQR